MENTGKRRSESGKVGESKMQGRETQTKMTLIMEDTRKKGTGEWDTGMHKEARGRQIRENNTKEMQVTGQNGRVGK